jgi:hypothetical protein
LPPPPSVILFLDKEVAGNEEGINNDDTNDADEDIDAASAAADNAPTDDDVNYATMPPKVKPIPKKAAPKKESATAAAKPPPPAAAAAAAAATSFSVDAGDPLTTHYYAEGVYGYADLVFRVNSTIQKGEYQIQMAEDGLSVSFVRAIPSRSFDKKIIKKSWVRITVRAALASSLGTAQHLRCSDRMCAH